MNNTNNENQQYSFTAIMFSKKAQIKAVVRAKSQNEASRKFAKATNAVRSFDVSNGSYFKGASYFISSEQYAENELIPEEINGDVVFICGNRYCYFADRNLRRFPGDINVINTDNINFGACNFSEPVKN